MQNTYKAIIKKETDWWLGWIEEVPGVNCQEKTYDELIHSLTQTLQEAIQMNKDDALRFAGESYKEVKINI